ncbi:MAG: hypothetical protein GC146_11880 [Limimaricola sp.]|uniref:hypothetical protein n=1 Tax=Limimaricola sp. TaxID=2211665 RepID=UPI001DA70BAC|nr:hypothetical protein [Limimaricola sp.]MBI1417913.1 hypothetical protein [Limimaricola sp.]
MTIPAEILERLSGLIALDLTFYRDVNIDLRGFSDEALYLHYFMHGYREGRPSSAQAMREGFLARLTPNRALEIGPFCNPCLRGADVDYLDVFTTEELQQKATALEFDAAGVPDIDYVSTDRTMRCVDKTYELIFSSHNLEHQPDLIGHLCDVGDRLESGGRLALIVPNARYCFDAALPLSSISDVFEAHAAGRDLHTLTSIINTRALSVHNDAAQHWREAGTLPFRPTDPARVAEALTFYDNNRDNYNDVHAWRFDPLALADILNCLIALDRIPFGRLVCNGPVRDRLEFTLTLHRDARPEA